MDPSSTKPRPYRIAAVLAAQIEALDEDEIAVIERLHRARPMENDPAFHRATDCLSRAKRKAGWLHAQGTIFTAATARDLPQRVRYAAYDAAMALLTRDVIDPVSFAVLYGPWGGAADDHVLMVS